MVEFIIAQVLGGISLILTCVSYFCSKKSFLLFQLIANAFYGASFLALSGFVAGINTFISIIRIVIFYLYEKKDKQIPIYYLFVFSILYIVVGIVFYNGYWDILTTITPIMFTFAMTIKNMLYVNYFMLIPNILLFVYCVCNRFYTSGVLDLIEVIVIIISIITIYKSNKLKNNEDKTKEKSNG